MYKDLIPVQKVIGSNPVIFNYSFVLFLGGGRGQGKGYSGVPCRLGLPGRALGSINLLIMSGIRRKVNTIVSFRANYSIGV